MGEDGTCSSQLVLLDSRVSSIRSCTTMIPAPETVTFGQSIWCEAGGRQDAVYFISITSSEVNDHDLQQWCMYHHQDSGEEKNVLTRRFWAEMRTALVLAELTACGKTLELAPVAAALTPRSLRAFQGA